MVTDQKVDLNSIIVNGYDPEEGSMDEVFAQELKVTGAGGKQYYWLDGEDDDGNPMYGWYDDDTEKIPAGEVMLSPGDGFWTKAPSSAFKFQSSGQVNTTGTTITLVGNGAAAGKRMVVNPRPVKVDINDLEVSGYNPDDGSMDEVFAQELKVTGAGGKQYYWLDGEDDDGNPMYGWYDDDTEKIPDNTVFIEAGDGLWVKAPSSKFVINIPGVKVD